MNKEVENKPVVFSILVFLICLAVHTFEVLFLKTDETVFAECFVNKMFGILVLFGCLRLCRITWRDLGFVKEKLPLNCLKGFALCIVFYAIGFVIEFIMLNKNGTPAHMEFFVTGFSLTGNVVKHTGIGFVIMCIFFNIINVWMEEGVFRGLFIYTIGKKYSTAIALWIPAILFGFWHLVTPFRSLLTGEMTVPVFLVMSVGYIVLSIFMGLKWGMLYKLSGTIWIGMADHFFNNCVVTNLLHVVSEGGIDEMQIARVLIGELTSFIAVLIYYFVKTKSKKE